MPVTDSKRPRLNPGLYSAHRAMMLLYAFLACGMELLMFKEVMFSSSVMSEGSHDWGLLLVGLLFFIPAAIHFYAMYAARRGKPSGRVVSQIVGVFMVLGFPIGTIIGGYILYQTGKKWQGRERISKLRTTSLSRKSRAIRIFPVAFIMPCVFAGVIHEDLNWSQKAS